MDNHRDEVPEEIRIDELPDDPAHELLDAIGLLTETLDKRLGRLAVEVARLSARLDSIDGTLAAVGSLASK